MTSSPAAVTTPEALLGPVRRSLYRDAEGRRDETTQVVWFQGPGLYVDLRRPAGLHPPRPDLTGLTGPAGLATAPAPVLRWLGAHEGFAGTFTVTGDLARWDRLVDLQPPAGVPDEGRLHWDGTTLVEVGVHSAYVEHWHPEPAPVADAAAVRLRERGSGRPGVLVRVGARFGVARGRAAPLPPGARLTALLLRADAQERAALLDCEVALGRIDPDGRWVVEMSTLPYREGDDLAPVDAGDRFTTCDVGTAGPLVRTWDVVRREGTTLLPAPGGHRSDETAAAPTQRQPAPDQQTAADHEIAADHQMAGERDAAQ
ncbi:hypothetical protein [Kineosporia sp. A_224]|uniref:hypothetical protein n=1 Tax=Kineosporia sp. A_224 TaxID=1962180 RepID=UPI000B4BBE70|nr:hypothetical protein [Kineosporia sp. A_224]